MNSRKVAMNKRFTTWRWIAVSDWRTRSRRERKDAVRTPPSWPERAFARFQPDRKAASQSDQGGMAANAAPQVTLILIPPQQIFGFFMKLLDPITMTRVPSVGLISQVQPKSGLGLKFSTPGIGSVAATWGRHSNLSEVGSRSVETALKTISGIHPIGIAAR